MTLRPALVAALPLVLVLGACAKPGPFPSLAVRDSERVSGTLAPPATAHVPPPPSAATVAELGTLAERARAAHQRFLAAAPEARSVVAGAAGSSSGSDGWSRAQVAVANLESIRSDAMIALADIDRLFVEAATSGTDIAGSESARTEISALVADQDRVIAGLLGQLGS